MERIGGEVERALARTGDGKGLSLSHITSVWPTAVGDAVARQAWPLRLGRDGTLHVATSSATWAFELDRLGPQIAEQLAAAMGESAPVKFRFRVGPVPEPGASPEASADTPKRAPVPSREEAAAAASAAAEIEDPELRELVSRAALASLAKARSDRSF